jgi:hypothetical protein
MCDFGLANSSGAFTTPTAGQFKIWSAVAVAGPATLLMTSTNPFTWICDAVSTKTNEVAPQKFVAECPVGLYAQYEPNVLSIAFYMEVDADMIAGQTISWTYNALGLPSIT